MHVLQALQAKLLKLVEPLLVGGEACRQAGKKLATVVYGAHKTNNAATAAAGSQSRPTTAGSRDSPSSKNGGGGGGNSDEAWVSRRRPCGALAVSAALHACFHSLSTQNSTADPVHCMPSPARVPPPLQAAFVRLAVEPEAAAAIAEVLARHGEAAQELVGAADAEGCSQGNTLKGIMTSLVLAGDVPA